MPPLAAGAHEVEQTIQQLSHVRGPRPSTGLGGRDERLQQAELIVRQRLAGAKVSNQRAVSRRPHRGLQTGNRLKRCPIGQDQPAKPAPSSLCKRALSRLYGNGRGFGLSLVIETDDSIRNGAGESVGIGEGAIGEIMLLEVAPAS